MLRNRDYARCCMAIVNVKLAVHDPNTPFLSESDVADLREQADSLKELSGKMGDAVTEKITGAVEAINQVITKSSEERLTAEDVEKVKQSLRALDDQLPAPQSD